MKKGHLQMLPKLTVWKITKCNNIFYYVSFFDCFLKKIVQRSPTNKKGSPFGETQ